MPVMGVGGALALRSVATLNNAQFLTAASAMEAKSDQMAARFNAASRKMQMAGAVIAGALALSVKAASDFEQSMANTQSVAKATAEEFRKLSDMALHVGFTTRFSAKEAADAMYWLASAGQKAADIASTLPGVLTLASATAYDLADTTETVVSTLASLGLQATDTDRVINVFAATIGNSLANMDKLSESMKYAGTVAKVSGQQIEDLAMVLGQFYNAGMRGSMAGTAYRRVMIGLLDPHESLIEHLMKVGGELDRINPKYHDMADVVDYMNEKMVDTTTVFRAFSKRGGPAMLYLLRQGGEALRKFRDSISGTQDAYTMMAKQMDTLQSQMKVLRNALAAAGIVIGRHLMPYVREIVGHFILWVQQIEDMDRATVEFRVKATALIAILLLFGPKLVSLAIGAVKAASGIALLADKVAYLAIGVPWAKLMAAGGPVAFFLGLGVALADNEKKMNALSEATGKWAEERDRMVARHKATMEALDPADTEMWNAVFAAQTDEMASLANRHWEATRGIVENNEEQSESASTAAAAFDEYAKLFGEALDSVNAARAEEAEAMLMADLDIQHELAMYEDMIALREQLAEAYKESSKQIVVAMREEQEELDRLTAWYEDSMEKIREESEFAKEGLVHVLDTMTEEMVKALEKNKPLLEAIFRGFLTALADMAEALIRQALISVIIAEAEAMGVLSVKGFFDWTSWAKILPMMATAAAAMAAIKALRSRLKFHEGGAPYEEGWKYLRSDESVVRRQVAQRGGYGHATPGMMEGPQSIQFSVGEVHIHDDRDVEELSRKLVRGTAVAMGYGGVG